MFDNIAPTSPIHPIVNKEISMYVRANYFDIYNTSAINDYLRLQNNGEKCNADHTIERVNRIICSFPPEALQFRKFFDKLCADAKVIQTYASQNQTKSTLKESLLLLYSKQRVQKEFKLNEIDPLKMHLYRGEGNGGLSIGETPALKSFS